MQRMQADGPDAVYGIAEQLEQLLDGAVLAAAAVQRHERHVRALVAEPVDEVRADVDRHHLVAEPLERVLDARARAQRDLPLERVAALEDRDLHPALRRSGSTRASGSAAGRRRRRSARRGARLGAGQRAVERDLLADDLADPPDRPRGSSSSPTPEKFSRISEPPRPSR